MTDTDQEREDENLRRMLKTPPKPKRSPRDFVALDGAILVADVQTREGGSMVADLYRNISDFRHGRAMERAVRLFETQMSPAQHSSPHVCREGLTCRDCYSRIFK